ncbi:MAG: methylmalonyl Co-A mutase-associated GTPase MeaB [Rhizobiaceae bacterium]
MRLDALVSELSAGNVAALSRCITLIEDGEVGSALRRAILPLTGGAIIVGFTGAPGVGKSTLVDAYIAELRRTGLSVAVAAVDPSSPISGGAVLGDRIRMHRHTGDAGVFIRSIASRGHLGGVSESIHWTIDVMDAAGRDIIIVETVGTGQSEVEIAEIADVCVVVNAPGLGDDVQAIKAGLLEIADVLVVNKADMPLADLAAKQLKGMLKLREKARQDVPLVTTSAKLGDGIARMHSVIMARIAEVRGNRAEVRERRMRRLIAQAVGNLSRRLVLDNPNDETEALMKTASRGEITIDEAARKILARIAPED